MVGMDYYGPKELADAFRTVRKNTLIIAEEIEEKHYGFRATPATRTVGQLLVHIANVPKLQYEVHGVRKLNTLVGFDFPGFVGPIIADEQNSRSKSEIVSLLRAGGDSFGTWLAGLSDGFLGEPVALPAGMSPASKTRFEMILGVKEHEMHHRGQLMLIERMIGIVPHLTREMEARLAAMQAAKA